MSETAAMSEPTTHPFDERVQSATALLRRWSWRVIWALALAWAAGAIYYDGPFGKEGGNFWLMLAWIALVIAALYFGRLWVKATVLLGAFLGVLLPWLNLDASNEREWYPEWAETPYVTFEGGTATFHNYRNFAYGDDGSVEERWETRTVQLRNLRGVDYFHDNFGGDLLAHPILSFDFGPDGHLALSIETRREVGESFTELGGFYKYFDLGYVWGDEQDMIRVRVLRDEPIYLYRLTTKPVASLFLFMDSVRTTNALAVSPRFYNVLTANCTTSLFAQTPELKARNFDIRMLLNARLDELAFEDGFLETDGLEFEALRARALVNEDVLSAGTAEDFWRQIRENRPGFSVRLAEFAAAEAD
ncbi:MAG: DUF4105 domain-containing protein [Pseudomonadota bacterium]